MEINILILTYNRLKSLQRLLRSLSNAKELQKVNLFVSCDFGASQDILDFLSDFKWNYGEFKVIQQSEHLGVKKHNIHAIEKASEWGNTLILEDDLYLAPHFANYIRQVFPTIAGESKVKALSLYRYSFMEENHFPFDLVPNSEFVYYQQRPCSKGCFYSQRMAAETLAFFKDFKGNYSDYALPSKVSAWDGNKSWLKAAYCFLQDEDAYLAYPRFSLATDFGDVGEHMERKEHRIIHHSPLYLDSEFSVKELKATINVYDAFYELKPWVLKSLVPELESYDFEMDLHGFKSIESHSKSFMLSSKQTESYEKRWARVLKPEISNIFLNQSGEFYSLAETRTFKDRDSTQKKEEDFLYYYPDTKFTDLLKLKWSEIKSRV